jgi:hypothetical protein
MSVSASFFSSSTAAILLNTSGNSGDVYLPRTLSTIGRVITLKDTTGNAYTSSVSIRCTTGDSFESGATLFTLQQNYGQVTFLAGADQKWYQLGGTYAFEAQVSSFYTSSIVGDGSLLSNVITPTQLTSSVAGLGTSYICTTQLVSTTSSLLGLYGQVTADSLTSTVEGLGTASYISTSQLTSTVEGLYTTISSYTEVAELTSTIEGLGSANYVSTTGLNTSLVSTLQGLGSAGYVSSLGALTASTMIVGNAASFSTLQADYMSSAIVTTSSLITQQFTMFTPSSLAESRYVITGTVQGASGNIGGVSSFYQIQYSDDGSNWYSSLTISTTVGYIDRSQVRYLSTNLFGVVLTPYGAGSGGFYTSTDGKNWFKRGDPGYQQYTDVTYNGTHLVTNGHGQLKYSTDLGATYLSPVNCNWEPAAQFGRETNFATAYNSTTGMMVACGGGNGSNPTMIKYTTNATTWSNVTFTSSITGLNQWCYDIALGGTTGSRWVCVGPFGGFYSDNASNWSPCVGLTAGYVLDYLPATWTVAYSRPLDRWIVGGYQRLHTSADGITYSSNLWSNAIGMDILAKAEWLNGKYYATGRLLSGCNISTSVISSENGSNWQGSAITGGISVLPTLSYQNYQTGSIAYGALQTPIVASTPITTSGANILIGGTDIASGYYDATGMYSSMQVQGFVSTASLVSTVEGISTSALDYYENSEVTSTVAGLGQIYLSSIPTTISVSSLTVSTTGTFSTINTHQVSSTSNSYSTLRADYLYLTSSSTNFLIETDGIDITIGGNAFTANYLRSSALPSTLAGFNYVSSTQLVSTTEGLNTYISSFIDVTEITSTVIGLGTATYTSTNALDITLTSTTAGLGTATYISSTQLTSTLEGLRSSLYGASATFTSSITRDLYISNSLTVNSNVYFKAATAFSTLAFLNNSTFLTVADIVSTVDSVLNNQPTIQQIQSYNF